MNEDDVEPPRFTGRTYGRSRKSSGVRNAEEATDNRAVPVKAAMSISKWGKANYVPVRDSLDGATEPKRSKKMESRGEDPFSFDTEDKRKLNPVKKDDTALKEQESHQPTKLPASRIVVKGEGYEEFQRLQKEEELEDNTSINIAPTTTPALRTYSRNSKKPVIMDQFVEVGRQMPSGETVYFSEARRSPAEVKSLKRDVEEEDEIFPIQFKRDPLKTYSGEVVTPVDKPDSPPFRKYKPKGGPRGRKPLIVSDPELIEEYKRNYAAQQLIVKPDAAIKGLSNSTVVSKQELANESQGTTVVVVCKPKGNVERGEVQTKYFSKNSKPKGTLVPVTPEVAAQGENGSSHSVGLVSGAVAAAPVRTSARLQHIAAVSAAVKTELSPSGGDVTSSLSSESLTSNKQSTKKSKNAEENSPETSEAVISSLSSTSSPVSLTEGSSQGDGSAGRGGKRYRIFKTRTPQVEDIPKLHVANFDEHNQSLVPPFSEQETEQKTDVVPATEDNQTAMQTEEPVLNTMTDSPTDSTAQPEILDSEEFTKIIDSSSITENQLSVLQDVENDKEPDMKGELEITPESSEQLTSQESPSSSQTLSEEGSQKEVATFGAPRKFFKSKKSLSGSSDLHRKVFGNSPQKSPAKAMYNARSWYNKHEADREEDTVTAAKDKSDSIVLLKESEKGPKLKREVHWPTRQYDEAFTSLKVSKTHKELYTVVHNVKQTHEVQELGETQDFMDEVDYLLDSLQDTNSTTIRCLSCLKLAEKCISPAFRMHLRAHGTVTKIFSLLHDACSDQCLALSTSSIMFMLSRDRLNMDLDQDSLNLMLKLNELDATDRASLDVATLRDLEKTKQKVKELLAQLQQETHAREIDLGFVSTGNLAMESLLSLTSRRAGEWFKEELRSAGGLDHIVDSVKVCEHGLPEDLSSDIEQALPVLRKLDRCIRVLENISFMNLDNQNYLIAYKNAVLLQACTRTLRLCQSCLPMFKILTSVEEDKSVKDLPGYTLLTCMLGVLRVLLNVTHENQLGNLEQAVETSLMESIVRCLTTTQWCIPPEQRFDLAVLCLGLLINLVEHRHANRQTMMSLETQVQYTEKSQPRTMSAIRAVVELFVQREEAARAMEEDTLAAPDLSTSESPNKSGEWKETETGIQWITNNLKKAKEEEEKLKSTEEEEEEGNQTILEDDEETFTKALHKAGKHMENSIVASYAGLLLGSTIIDNKEYATSVKQLVPNQDFSPMIRMLRKFLNFMNLTTAFGSKDINGIMRVIDVLESA